MKRSIWIISCLSIAAIAWAAVYSGTIIRADDFLYIKSGGEIEVEDGGILTIEDGGTLVIDATAALSINGYTVVATQYSADPDADYARVSVPGCDANDYLQATLNTKTSGNIYIRSAEADIAYATINLSADPTETINITVTSWEN